MKEIRVFHFAIPRSAPRDQREGALAHIAVAYGIEGIVTLERVEPTYRLYRIEWFA